LFVLTDKLGSLITQQPTQDRYIFWISVMLEMHRYIIRLH